MTKSAQKKIDAERNDAINSITEAVADTIMADGVVHLVVSVDRQEYSALGYNDNPVSSLAGALQVLKEADDAAALVAANLLLDAVKARFPAKA